MHEKSIELLNRAVADELAAVHQYMYFHFHLDDQGFGPLAMLFKQTAIEEMRHVEVLAERILFLKGDVEMVPAGPVEQITDPQKMLLKARGKRMMMWGDMLLHYPEAIDLIPNDTIIMDWHYGPQHDYPSIAQFRDKGFEVFVVPALSSWVRLFPDYEMALENNIMRMRAVPSLALPAGRAVELRPGGYHVMLMDLKQQMKEGEVVPVTLVVETAGKRETIEVKAPVRAPTARGEMMKKH